MEQVWVLDIVRKSLQTMLLVGGPLLLVALIVGLIISVFQALTQINEATLSFIPKIFAVGGALLILGPWMIRILVAYTQELYMEIGMNLR